MAMPTKSLFMCRQVKMIMRSLKSHGIFVVCGDERLPSYKEHIGIGATALFGIMVLDRSTTTLWGRGFLSVEPTTVVLTGCETLGSEERGVLRQLGTVIQGKIFPKSVIVP